MDECELAANCVVFYERMVKMPSTARLMKGAYCKGNHQECARYIVSKSHGHDNVPDDLYPSDFDCAKKMIKPNLGFS